MPVDGDETGRDGPGPTGRPGNGGWAPIPDPTSLTTQQLRETEAQLNQTILERVSNLRELLEQRLDGMDRATSLVAVQVREVLDGADVAFGRIRTEFAAADQSLRELMGERLDGMDKANQLLAGSVGKFPSDVDRAIGGLKAVLSGEIQRVQDVVSGEIVRIGDINLEKFKAIDGTFASNALALTAALAAQEKAVATQNTGNTLAINTAASNTKETIAANAVQAQTGLKSLGDQFADLKERVVRIESTGVGAASVTGSPFDAAGLRQAEKAAEQAAAVAQAAQARAIMALVISGVLLLISMASVIFAITKK